MVVLLLLITAALMTIVTLGGWEKLQGAKILQVAYIVLFQALPYVLVLIVVAGLIGRSRPPAAIGVPYVKE